MAAIFKKKYMAAIAKFAKKKWKAALALIKNRPRVPEQPQKLLFPEDVVSDLPPYIKVLRNGVVQRVRDPPYEPPSETDEVLSKDVIISSSTDLLVRIYIPANLTGLKIPIFVYYHSGGFFVDSATSNRSHGYISQLVNESNIIVVSVDYRLAPEFRLPVAFDDSWEALKWVASHFLDQQRGNNSPSRIEKLKGGLFSTVQGILQNNPNPNPNPSPKEDWLIKHGDFNRLFVGGDEIGGTIAHYLSSKVGPSPLPGEVKILGTILCYPFFCHKTISEENVLFRMFKLAYPKRRDWVESIYVNPFLKGPRHHDLELKRMMVCFGGEQDENRDITGRFVEAMRADPKFSGQMWCLPVTTEENCFYLSNPTSTQARNFIQQISNFIHNR